MATPVYYLDARSKSSKTSSIAKIRALLAKLNEIAPDAVRKNDLCAIKIHFGELGNDAYISPVFARAASDAARAHGAKPFFTDTNTLYTGSRSNAVDHLETAIAHGFVPEVCGAPVIIADGLQSNDWRDTPLPAACTRFKSAKIASGILDADSMIVMSHVKGHEMAGFGGAIKNLAMGCAPFVGKREQHCVKFQVNETKCISCGQCVTICPTGAATLAKEKGAKASINQETCIGCGECMTVCAPKAIGMDWDVGLTEFTEKMTEYALGALSGKAGRTLFINIVTKVVPICDCVPWSDAPVVPDIGFLASTDPVAIDQASFDLVKAAPVWPGSMLDGKAGPGDDKFTAMHPETRSELQLAHGEKIGLGSRTYELIRL
ncbi:MAG: 4Fe-4S ferredoxin [Spirochaetes bacterium GWB1_59_5]|nr:MAG: 4Fe-4S ferredoxin [Spirochaetes bacterium GWB1_59_5]